jgi:hypothetical protein
MSLSKPPLCKPSTNKSTNSRLITTLSLMGFAGPVLFWVILLVAQSIYPDHSGWELSISTLVLGPSGWLLTMNFFFLTVCTAAFGMAVYLAISSSISGRIAAILLIIVGSAQMITAVFPVDVNPYGPNSPAYIIHKTAVTISVGSFPVGSMLLVPNLWKDKQWRLFVGITVFSALAVFCMDLLWLASIFINPDLIKSWFGIYERILLSIPLLWMFIISARLFYLNNRR